MRCAKSSSAKYGCEYCENCAIHHVVRNKKASRLVESHFSQQETQISQELNELLNTQESENEEVTNLRQQLNTLSQDKENELQKAGRKQLCWPSSTMDGNLRTIDNIKNITEEIERNPDILKSDPDFCKGIKGRSLFLNQPLFNMLTDMPCEYMHLLCLGVVRRMVELCFKVGENRDRITKRKLSDPNLFNELIKCIQLAREFSRRVRNLDFGTMKASEYRNILLFFFPIILDCIPEEFKQEKETWLHLVFMIRSCVIPNNEFHNVDKNDIETACKKFYSLYEQLFGTVNCTYSVHVLPSHLLKIRGNRPLTYKSAFKFESFFSEMKHLFKAGTVSPIKQILENCYVKRILEHHYCEKTMYIATEKKPKIGVKFNPPKENNSLIYVFNDNQKHELYKVEEIIDNNHFRCKIQGKFPFKHPLTLEYNWTNVGVFRLGPLSEETKIIKRSEICGKVIQVNNLLITCPKNVLFEQ